MQTRQTRYPTSKEDKFFEKIIWQTQDQILKIPTNFIQNQQTIVFAFLIKQDNTNVSIELKKKTKKENQNVKSNW